VIVQEDAGTAIGFSNAMYHEAGARISSDVKEVFAAPMIVKVKEPQPSEIEMLHEGQVLFGYLHLAPEADLTAALLKKKIIGIAYETITDKDNRLPLLTPMSEIAGRIAIQVGAVSLQMANGGNGTLLGGTPGVMPGKVLIIGGGVVGTEAAKMAVGLGADVTITDIDLNRLRYLNDTMGAALKTCYSDAAKIKQLAAEADLVVGAVLIPGKQAPKLVSREVIKIMKAGSVLVDVAIDQGGCAETSKATTHSNPTYIVDDVVHYCVANMPGACARTSTEALTNATLPYVMSLANKNYQQALLDDAGFLNGLNIYFDKVTNAFVANDLGYDYFSLDAVALELQQLALKEAV
jgi:alanine dehydrogenase